MSPGSTGAAAVEAIGVVTEAVTAEEGEATNHTALGEGAFQLCDLVHRIHRVCYRGRGRGL